ncbi:MAG TPA: hypothetical protein VE987_07445 [Polyangiaceae bacterium]|nr:hypothetical protein [Polyangiaceae bacterium]
MRHPGWLLIVAGCATGARSRTEPGAAAVPAATLDARAAAGIDASDGGDRGAPEAEAPAPRGVVEPGDDHGLVFRQILGGSLSYPPRRVTWVMAQGAGRARLTIACELAKRAAVSPGLGLRIDGHEDDPALWDAPATAGLEGNWDGASPSFSLGLAGSTRALEPCTTLPRAVLVTCRQGVVPVLAAGARLVVLRALPRKHADDAVPWRWEPAAASRVAAQECRLERTDADAGASWSLDRAFGAVPSSWPLVFVPARRGARGVEWVYENDDAVVQQGAYRWMAASD